MDWLLLGIGPRIGLRWICRPIRQVKPTGLPSCLSARCTSPLQARSRSQFSCIKARSVPLHQSAASPWSGVVYWQNDNVVPFAQDESVSPQHQTEFSSNWRRNPETSQGVRECATLPLCRSCYSPTCLDDPSHKQRRSFKYVQFLR